MQYYTQRNFGFLCIMKTIYSQGGKHYEKKNND